MPEQDDLFVDRTPRHRRVARWSRRHALPALGRHGKRMAVPAIVTASIFGGLLMTSQSGGAAVDAASTPTSLGNVQQIDYTGECTSGCSKEEVQELWNSYANECNDEDCYMEEVFELSGGYRDYNDPGHGNPAFWQMFSAFQNRLGKREMFPMKAGRTNATFDTIIQIIDGRVIKTPKVRWDGYP